MIGIFAICFEFERIKYATAVTITHYHKRRSQKLLGRRLPPLPPKIAAYAVITLFLFPVQTLILGFRRDDFLVLGM